MVLLFQSLIRGFNAEPGLGTFLEFSISSTGIPRAKYTHGTITFFDYHDLNSWWLERTEKLQREKKELPVE